jgi:hypothetical protein
MILFALVHLLIAFQFDNLIVENQILVVAVNGL